MIFSGISASNGLGCSGKRCVSYRLKAPDDEVFRIVLMRQTPHLHHRKISSTERLPESNSSQNDASTCLPVIRFSLVSGKHEKVENSITAHVCGSSFVQMIICLFSHLIKFSDENINKRSRENLMEISSVNMCDFCHENLRECCDERMRQSGIEHLLNTPCAHRRTSDNEVVRLSFPLVPETCPAPVANSTDEVTPQHRLPETLQRYEQIRLLSFLRPDNFGARAFLSCFSASQPAVLQGLFLETRLRKANNEAPKQSRCASAQA